MGYKNRIINTKGSGEKNAKNKKNSQDVITFCISYIK